VSVMYLSNRATPYASRSVVIDCKSKEPECLTTGCKFTKRGKIKGTINPF